MVLAGFGFGWAQRWLQDLLTSAIGQFVDVTENFKFSFRNGVSMSNVRLRCREVERIPGFSLPVAIERGSADQLVLQIPWMNLVYGKIVLRVSGVEVVFRERAEGEWEGGLARARSEAQKQALLANCEMELLARALRASRGESDSGDPSDDDAGDTSSGSSAKGNKGGFTFGSLTARLLSKVGKVLLAKLVICVEDVHVQYQDSPRLGDAVVGGDIVPEASPVDAITANLLRSSSSSSSSAAEMEEGTSGSGLGGEARSPGGRAARVKAFGVRLGRLESIQKDQNGSVGHEGGSPTTMVTLSELSIYTCNLGGHGAGAPFEDARSILEPMSCTISVNVYHGDQDQGNSDFYDISCELNRVHLNIDNELLRAAIVVVDKLEIWQLRSVYGRFRPSRWRTAATGRGDQGPRSAQGERWAREGWKYAISGVLHGISSRRSRSQRLRRLRLRYPYSYGKYAELYKQRLVRLASGQRKNSFKVGFVDFLRDFEEKEDTESIVALRSHVGETMGSTWLSEVQGEGGKTVEESMLSSFWQNWMSSDASGGRDPATSVERNFSKLEEIYDKMVEHMPRTPRMSAVSPEATSSEVVCRFQISVEAIEIDVSEFRDRGRPVLEVGVSGTRCKLEVLESSVTKVNVRARDVYMRAGRSTLLRQLEETCVGESFVDLDVEVQNVGEAKHLSLKISCIVKPFICSVPSEGAIRRLTSFEIPIIETYHLSWLYSANQLETDLARSHAKAQYLMQYPYVNFQLILSEVCILLDGPSDRSLILRARETSVTSARHDLLESSSKAQLALNALKNNVDMASDMVDEHVMYHRLNCTVTEVDVRVVGGSSKEEKVLSTSLWTEVELLLLPDDKTQAVCKANVDFSNLKVKLSTSNLKESMDIASHNTDKLTSWKSKLDEVSAEIPDENSPGSLVEVRARFPSIAIDLEGFQGIQKPLKDHLRLTMKGLKAGFQTSLAEEECFVSISSIRLDQKTSLSTYTLLNMSLQELFREQQSADIVPQSAELYRNASKSFQKVTPEKKERELFKGTLNEKTWITSSLSLAIFEKKDQKQEKTVVFNAFCARINTRLLECIQGVSSTIQGCFKEEAQPEPTNLIERQAGPSKAIVSVDNKVTMHITVTNYTLEMDIVEGDEMCVVRIPKMNVAIFKVADRIESVEIFEEALNASLSSSEGSHLLIQKFDISTKLAFRPVLRGADSSVSTALDLWIQVPQLEIGLRQDDTEALSRLLDSFGTQKKEGSEEIAPKASKSTFPEVINATVDIKFLQCEVCGKQASLGSIVGLSEELYLQVNVADNAVSSFECGWRFLGLFMSIRDGNSIPSRVLLASLQPKQRGNDIPIIETNASESVESLELSVKNVQISVNTFCWDKFAILMDQLQSSPRDDTMQEPESSTKGGMRGFRCFAEDLEISINFEDRYEIRSPPVLIRTRLEFSQKNELDRRRVDLQVNHLLLDLPLKGLEEDADGELCSFKTFAFFDDLSLSLDSLQSRDAITGAINLGSLSLWVSHQNLSFLNTALATFGEKSAADAETSPAKTSSSKTSIDLVFSSEKFAALFSDDRFQRDSPIAEVAICDINTKCSIDPSSTTQCSASFKLLLDFYNYDKVAWEPVVEDWPLQIYYQGDNCNEDRKRKPVPSHKLLLQSKSQWNINVSEYTIETANILRQMLESLKLVSDGEVCAPRISSAKFTPYWLQNLTGLTVGYCFTDGSSSSANLSELRNKEEGQAPDENLVPLYIRKSSGRGGRYVSYKYMNKKIAARRSFVSQTNDQQWVSGRRPVIHFKIQGSTWSESLAMNTYAKHCVTLEDVEGSGSKPMKILCDVQRRANGGRLIVLHSCISVVNSCGFYIKVGSASPLCLEPICIRVLAPGESFWLPVQISVAGSTFFCLRMVLESEETKWSQPMNLDDFVGEGKKVRKFIGNCVRSEGEIMSFALNTEKDGSQYKLRVEPPVRVRNWLPVPMDSVLYRGEKQLLKSTIKPDADLNIHNVRNSGELSLFLRPDGFNWSDGISIPFSSKREYLVDEDSTSLVRESNVVIRRTDGDDGAKISLEVKCIGSVPMMIQITCPLRIYNHTGLDLGVRDKDQESSFLEVLPFFGENETHDLAGARSVIPGETDSEPVGLGIIASMAREEERKQQSTGTNLIEYKPANGGKDQARVQSCPTMFGLKSYHHNIQLQLRVKPDFRSESVIVSKVFNVEVLGEPTVIQVVASDDQHVPRRPKAYFFTVSTEISAFGSIGVHIRPRFIVMNKLEKEIIYRQEGSKVKHTLKAGGSEAVHADRLTQNPKLCVKLEDNAVWSGYFRLDKPGGIQMQMTGAGEDESMMLQVDVRELSFETWTISISEYQAGFAPYRIDNFTGDVLSYYQHKCESAEGMLQPYSSAVYTWDEPYMSHKLVIKLPGHGSLGAFPLDRVGSVHIVSVPVTSGARLNRNVHRSLQVLVKADGPTRVLAISDLSVHMPRRDNSRLPLSNKLLKFAKMSKKPSKEDAQPAQDSVFLMDVQVSHLGLSIIGKSSEILYLGMLDLQLKFEGGEKRDAITFKTRRIQIDNMLPNAALPVLLSIPAPLYQQESITSASDAITFKLSYWHANVANITCIESAVLKVPPILLDVDGSIFIHLHHFSEVLSWVDETSSITRVSSASSMNGKEEERPEHRLHFECIKISPIHITVSLSTSGLTYRETFNMSENPRGVNDLLLYALLLYAEFEGVKVLLSGYELNHAFIDRTTLQSVMGKHYKKALLREAVKILGSANVLGDPLGLVQHLGTGMWDFLSKPTVGLFQSALTLGDMGQFTAGLSAGSWSLLIHTVYALSNGVWKISKTARLAIAAEENSAEESMLGAVSRGIGGMIAAPVNGMEQNGLRGLVEGGVYGVLGAFGSPTATFLEALEKTSKALRDAASRMRPQTYRMRPPRIIKEGEPLAAYELSASLGELIVATVSSGEFRGEARVFSCVLPDGRCVLVTDGHVMMAHLAVGDAAELDWVIPTADIVTHDWEGLVATLTVLRRCGGLPISQKVVAFHTERDVSEFIEALSASGDGCALSPCPVPLLTFSSMD